MLNTPRTCNVRAKDFCELTVLHREDFDDVVLKFDSERVALEAIIMEKYSNEASEWELKQRAKKQNDQKLDPLILAKETNYNCTRTLSLLQSMETRMKKMENQIATNSKREKGNDEDEDNMTDDDNDSNASTDDDEIAASMDAVED